MNYEEGSEYSVPDGDGFSEATLTEAGAAPHAVTGRDLAAEGMFEYGSRVGFWRVMRLLRRARPAADRLRLRRSRSSATRRPPRPSAPPGTTCAATAGAGSSTGAVPSRGARAHPRARSRRSQRTIGERPLGWYCRYGPSVNTRRLLVEEGGFLYDSDAYNDDLPYWVEAAGQAAPGGAVQLGTNDVEVRQRRLRHRRRLLHLLQGRLRRALPRGAHAARR